MSPPEATSSPTASERTSTDNEQVAERLAMHRQLLSRLAHSDALTGNDIDSAYAQVTELMTTLLRVERGSVWRFDATGERLQCMDLFEWSERRHSRGAMITAQGVPAYFQALSQNRCIVATDAAADSATREFAESYLAPLGIGAMLDAPIWVGGRMVGVVCHEHVGGPRRWQFEEELIAGTIADFVARVIEASDHLRTERALGEYREHVDELTRVEQALRRSGENLRIVLGAAPVALVLTRLSDQHVVLANERCAALFEVPLDEVIGQRTRDYYDNPDERDAVIGRLVRERQLDGVLVRLKKRGGQLFWAELSARMVELDGQRCSLVGIFDVTAQKNLEEQLRALATFDSLTGAYNRRYFMELSQRERERSRRTGAALSVCLLDADLFKGINDHYGHVAGDHVLAAITKAIGGVLRKSDVLGRLGGEEFAILLPDTDLAGGVILAERVRSAVAAIELHTGDMGKLPPTSGRALAALTGAALTGDEPSDPYGEAELEAPPDSRPSELVRVTVSIGVAELRASDSVEALLKRADRALYSAKDRGRNRVES
jgi:diguanylate cyclase (GGDEF)-like protein/PAS domain S-box-containing protein